MKWYTTIQIQEIFGNVSRQRVFELAQKHNWQGEYYKSGRTICRRYLAEDVEKEIGSRIARGKKVNLKEFELCQITT